MMQGAIFTKDVVAKQLEELNKDYYGRRTWAQQFGAADLMKQRSIEGLKIDYGAAMGEAYDNSLAAKNAINASNLIQGQRQSLMEENRLALEEAYNSYLQNYGTGLATIQENANKNVQDITDALLSQADYTSRYANAHFDYLQALMDMTEAGEIDWSIWNQPGFDRYTNLVLDENGMTVVEDDNQLREFKSMYDIKATMFDENGELTAEGINILDQLENDQLLRDYSFGDYLSENDSDLYNWAVNENMYHYDPNILGSNTNAQMVKNMLGVGDEVYTGMERLAGLSQSEFSSNINALSESLEEANSKLYNGDLKSISDNEAQKLYKDAIVETLDRFGLQTSDLENYDSINKIIEEEVKRMTAEDITSHGQNVTNAAKKIINTITTDLENKRNFYNEELYKGAVQSSYNPNIWNNENYIDFMADDGKKISYLHSARLDTHADGDPKDKKNDNFTIRYNGKTYQLKTSKEVLSGDIVGEVNRYVRESSGRSLRKGDVFVYDNKLWVITNDGTARAVRNRLFNKHAEELTSNFVGTKSK